MKRTELRPVFRRWPRWGLFLMAVATALPYVFTYTTLDFIKHVGQASKEVHELMSLED